MRIGIDARPLIANNLTGIGVYLDKVLKYIAEHDRINDYYLYVNVPFEDERNYGLNFKQRIVPEILHFGWYRLSLPLAIKKDRINLFWGTCHTLPPLFCNIKSMITVHDLALFVNPDWGEPKNAANQKKLLPKSAKKATHIIAISNSTKNDLIKYCKINENKIDIVYLGCNAKKKESYLKTIKYDNPFFLYLGTIEPRKNIETIVKSFELFAKENDDTQLIIAGGLGWKYEETLNAINKSRYFNRIKMLGYISEEEKNALLENAIALVFPSHYEGFGIPILEAMSFGTPVISAKNSSLQEVGGDVAYYVDNENDIDYLAQLMGMIYSMTKAEKEQKKEECLKQASKFSWEKCGKETLSVINQLKDV